MITKISNQKNPLWYKDAVIYQLHVRAFHDSNGDGIGDFQGLIQRLDYLSYLGVNAVWLLPFYPSPLRDDGYDIADYENINPSYGTMEDFQEFLDEAHRRNIRVITELVINHTSDQHEWFQKSRRAPPGSYWRDFYVWSDDPNKYKGTRIIFKDFETSNWSWDPVAKSYYWHRFYSHQPDLNFDNPEVQKAVFRAFDFWMERGVDGMRLDAVPYLFEREGTSSENLPETHEFLKTLRSYIDSKYPGTMLLAEANQWPEDAVNYFGKGDECHMNFHFPLMPRLFMALKMEDRYSIIDILKQTPEIPENCQWATFLRNHDELTLEMVTDEERDYMYQVYANDPRARINLGVRRRLAPLAGNDRRQIELLNSLLFSLPGSPIIYYGDEIGMGDNIYLGDRDGVRTPFQWNLDRNAGFSRAHPQKLYLPIISSPEYSAESINVETQRANPTSLIWWMTKLISLRLANPVLSRGKFEFIPSSNPKVLTYLRQLGEETMICVVNLSRNAQFVEMDLSHFRGVTPMEVFGQTEFPTVDTTPYRLTLGSYSFYWLSMSSQPKSVVLGDRKLEKEEVTDLDLTDRRIWKELGPYLREFLGRARWFGAKGRKISSIDLVDAFLIPVGEKRSALAVVQVSYSEGLSENYLMGLGYAQGEVAQRMGSERPEIVIAQNQTNSQYGVFYDALAQAEFGEVMMRFISQEGEMDGLSGTISAQKFGDIPQELAPATFGGFEQSNSSFRFGKQVYLKFYRRLEEGENPEIEIGRFLLEKEYDKSPPLLSALTYRKGHVIFSMAIAQSFIASEVEGWSLFLQQIDQVSERLITEQRLTAKLPPPPPHSLPELMTSSVPEGLLQVAGYTLGLVQKLAVTTAQMHLALGVEDRHPAFIPEPFTPFHQRSVFQSFRNLADKTFNQLRASLGHLDPEVRNWAEQVIAAEQEIYDRFSYMRNLPIHALRSRIHGDYHLGQVLYTGTDFCVVDFEGEPARGIGERKLKRSPLKDVAGMLRSFDYAYSYHLKNKTIRDHDRPELEEWLKIWAQWAGCEYIKTYLNTMASQSLLPATPEQIQALLEMFLLEKALYEVGYELRNRPDWVGIPLQGILRVIKNGRHQK